MRRRADHTYTPDPNTAETPVTTVELERLIAALDGNGAGLSNRRALGHLLRRFEVTLDANHDQIRRLHTEISRTQLDNTRGGGAATTLHPADAFRYLTVEEQKSAVDGHLREKLQAFEQEERKIKDHKASLVRAGAQLRWAVTQLLDDPSVPDPVRRRFAQLLATADQIDTDLGVAPAAAGPALGADPPPAAPGDDLNSLLDGQPAQPGAGR